MATLPPLPANAAAWDQARNAFAKSILMDTPLATLAEDLDVPPWPVSAPDETPAAYVYLSYGQAIAALAARGLPPAQLEALITILNETNAFDQPFGEMMDELESAPDGALDEGSPLIRNLHKLKLPDAFPLEFSGLSAATLELCRQENVVTLADFVGFGSRLAQSVIVSGDVRALLNALAQKDEAALAQILPLRPGHPGLHLLEALALILRSLPPDARKGLKTSPSTMPPGLEARVTRLAVYFKADLDAARDALAKGTPPARLVAALASPELEELALLLLRPHLPFPNPATSGQTSSFWSRLWGRS